MVRAAFLVTILLTSLMAGCIAQLDSPEGEGEQEAIANLGGAPGETVTSVFPGDYDFSGPLSRPLAEGSLDILPAERVVIPSEIDGADILMGLHLPDTDEEVPVLLFASPYFGFLGGTNEVTDRGGSFGNLVESFVPHGYAVVGLAIRGTGGAGGCNDLMGPEETQDLDTAVTWLGTQGWSNGNVAMTGVSYDGSTPWGVASVGNPHLKTIIPISGVPDMHGLMYRNGSAETRGPVVLNALYYGGNIAAGTATPVQMAERVVCPDAILGLGWSAYTGVTGAYDPADFWLERDRKPGVEANYKGSVFSVQGLQDWNVDPSQVVPWVEQLDQQGIRTKQLLGQWGHAWPDSIGADGERAGMYRADYNEILLRWLDQELKGKEVDTGAPVQVMDNLGRWRNEAHYPPRDIDWQEFHLDAGRLSEEPGSAQSIRLRPIVNQQTDDMIFGTLGSLDIEAAADAADFVLGVPDEDLLIVGVPRVHVAVTPDGPGSFLGAYLFEREPDGGMNRLGWTSINLAYADGGTDMTPVIPGETIQAKMQMEPMDGVVRAGNELVLRVWLYTDADRLPSFPPTTVNLELGQQPESVLKLSTVQRGPEVYFEPPRPDNGEDEE